jgi:hypothetical protein
VSRKLKLWVALEESLKDYMISLMDKITNELKSVKEELIRS